MNNLRVGRKLQLDQSFAELSTKRFLVLQESSWHAFGPGPLDKIGALEEHVRRRQHLGTRRRPHHQPAPIRRAVASRGIPYLCIPYVWLVRASFSQTGLVVTSERREQGGSNSRGYKYSPWCICIKKGGQDNAYRLGATSRGGKIRPPK